MMTVVTHVRLKTGCEPDWDAAMRERLSRPKKGPGGSVGNCSSRSTDTTNGP
jgi:hypothetical protein